MNHVSIYELKNKVNESKILAEVEKRQHSSAKIGCSNFFLEYDISLIEKVLSLIKTAEKFKFSFDELNEYSRKLVLRDAALDELELVFRDHFVALTKKGIFLSWVNESDDSNSYFIEAYKTLLSGKASLPKNVTELKRMYDSYVSPRNLAFHQRNIKKFHLFRNEDLVSGNNTNFIPDYTPSFEESELIKNISDSLDILNNNLDVFTQSASFFFLFLYSMPFYNENYFISKYVLSSDLITHGYSYLGLSIGKTMDKYKDLLVRRFYETIDKNDHGDLSHFVSFFLDVFQDALSSLPMDLKIKENLAKNDYEMLSKKMSRSDRLLLGKITYATYFSSYGLCVKELEEESKVSLPTINRFLKKLKDLDKLEKTRIGKKDFFKLK